MAFGFSPDAYHGGLYCPFREQVREGVQRKEEQDCQSVGCVLS
jgi:hypothetical protein